MPVYVAFEIRFKNIVGAIVNNKSNGRATNGITETENLSFHELSFEGFFEFDREEQKTFDFEIEIGERFLVATNLIVISENNA